MDRIRRRTILVLTVIAMIGAAMPQVLAQSLPPAVNTLAGQRVAIHGYDPVAYFADGGPRPGRADLAVEHRGAVWRFANDANRRQFQADPDRFVPAFGGYCAYGVAQGYLVKIDPDAWAIVEGRLYLNYDRSVRETWLKDVPGYVKSAAAHWPKLVSQP